MVVNKTAKQLLIGFFFGLMTANEDWFHHTF